MLNIISNLHTNIEIQNHQIPQINNTNHHQKQETKKHIQYHLRDEEDVVAVDLDCR